MTHQYKESHIVHVRGKIKEALIHNVKRVRYQKMMTACCLVALKEINIDDLNAVFLRLAAKSQATLSLYNRSKCFFLAACT